MAENTAVDLDAEKRAEFFERVRDFRAKRLHVPTPEELGIDINEGENAPLAPEATLVSPEHNQDPDQIQLSVSREVLSDLFNSRRREQQLTARIARQLQTNFRPRVIRRPAARTYRPRYTPRTTRRPTFRPRYTPRTTRRPYSTRRYPRKIWRR